MAFGAICSSINTSATRPSLILISARGGYVPVFGKSPHLVINNFYKDWVEANSVKSSRTACTISVAWDIPKEGYVKLNMDGGCTGESGAINASGVLRDHSKNWLSDIVLSKGFGSALEAEL
ncbi:hypothetical protein Ddye_002762 [Dipteronia dyeriana]|uniref:Uncharacterized protein n=1 Tax=Dipteronia dyeriana TaxID=168575 RepID=A0AAD9XRP5_9ROSI|nr:hypothetical protein Ddye_002762 [Dipteronia dyeriana]